MADKKDSTARAPARRVITVFGGHRGVWAFAFAFCLAGAAKAADVKRMLSMCEEVARGMSVRGKEVTLPRSPGAYMCWGFIGAVQDVSRITDSSGARLLNIVGELGVHPSEFGLLMVSLTAAYFVGTLVANRLAVHAGVNRSIMLGSALLL